MANLLYLLPFVLALYLPIVFFTTYGIAVARGDVNKTFPYISDTGTVPPESCIFGQFVNIYACLAAIFMIIRYLQVKENILMSYGIGSGNSVSSRKRRMLVNKISLVIGLFADLGASLVGNFQEDNVIVVHVIGAFLAFILGGVYAWIQAILAYYLPTIPGSSKTCRHIRLMTCIAFVIAFILFNVFTVISMNKFKGNDVKHWQPHDGGYDEHLVATISEWLMAILLSFFFATFVIEYRKIGFHGSVVMLNTVNTQSMDEESLLVA